MNKKLRFIPISLILIGVLIIAIGFFRSHEVAVLSPKGLIAEKERALMITTVLLSLVVVIPVFFMTFFFAWKYRASNTKAKYTPEWDHHPVAEFTWWAVPSLIIVVLAVIAWNSSHELDPYKPLVSTTPPVKIQVIALQWKWLFIYPDQNIATVNYIQFPKGTPIDFQITSDAPMNSFWIPQLGGQIYAMTGMSTQLHLIASENGSFRGSSANISGKGFAGMKFTANATSRADFDAWVASARRSQKALDSPTYAELAKPSQPTSTSTYFLKQPGLYDEVVMKYMSHMPAAEEEDSSTSHSHSSMPGMEMP